MQGGRLSEIEGLQPTCLVTRKDHFVTAKPCVSVSTSSGEAAWKQMPTGELCQWLLLRPVACWLQQVVHSRWSTAVTRSDMQDERPIPRSIGHLHGLGNHEVRPAGRHQRAGPSERRPPSAGATGHGLAGPIAFRHCVGCVTVPYWQCVAKSWATRNHPPRFRGIVRSANSRRFETAPCLRQRREVNVHLFDRCALLTGNDVGQRSPFRF